MLVTVSEVETMLENTAAEYTAQLHAKRKNILHVIPAFVACVEALAV